MTTEASATRNRLAQWLAGPWGFPIAIWLAQRAYLQAIGSATVAVAGVPAHSRPGVFGTYFNWDSGWLGCIAASGYFGPACGNGATAQRFAFFPLYPLLSRGVAELSSGGEASVIALTFGMWLVAAAGSLVCVIAIYRLAALDREVGTARRAALLFAFGPYSLFLVASYSESTYLAFAILAWYFGRRGRWLSCGVAGLLATLSRASGIFLVPALLVLYITERRRADQPLRIGQLACVLASALGVVGYWVWLAVRTGDLMAWFHAQGEGWNRKTQWPWLTLINQGIHVLREPRPDWQIQAVLESIFAVLLVIAVVCFVRRRAWAEATLVGFTSLSLMTSTSYLSLARNTLTLFPCAILLADVLDRSRRLFWLVFVTSSALLTFNAIQFALGHWAD
jgi:hypothetical protein